jgi:hypothetical protein
MPLFALVPCAFVFMVLGLDRAQKAELAALKKEYVRLHGKNPLGPKSNDLNWLRKETKTAGKDGAPGKDGRHGRPGKAGKDGRPGKAGKDGRPGKAGKDAKDVSINNTINNHYYAASGSDSDSDTLSFDEPAAGGAAVGYSAQDSYFLEVRAARSEKKSLEFKYEKALMLPEARTRLAAAIAFVAKAFGMRTIIAAAGKKTVAAEEAWIAARNIRDEKRADLKTLKTNKFEKEVLYQQIGLNKKDLSRGQRGRLLKRRGELELLGKQYIDAVQKVDAHIWTLERVNIDYEKCHLNARECQEVERELKVEYEDSLSLAKEQEVQADALMAESRDTQGGAFSLEPTLGWESDSQVDDEPFANEQHRPAERSRSPPTPTPTPTPSMNGGRGEAATSYFNWIQDDMQRRRDAAEQQQRHGYASTDPGPARGGGWDAPPRGWDAQPQPQHPWMMPSNAEDRRDPREPGAGGDAAAAGPAPKRARGTRHDGAAGRTWQQHGGMERFLEKR